MTCRIFVYIALLLLPILVHAQPADRYLSAPFPAELVRSPDGKRVAWVFNEKGVRNIFVAHAPAFDGQQLTAYTTDNGVELKDLVFSPAGDQLVFTRGNARNREGHPANPAALPEAPEQTVWVAHIDSNRMRSIGHGAHPVWCPDSQSIVYLHNGSVYRVSMQPNVQPIRLTNLQGTIRDIRWSPNHQRIAFILDRDTYSWVGLLDVQHHRVTFPDASTDKDIQPVWSPDGQSLAYIRIPNEKGLLPFTAQRHGRPWSIRIMSVQTGEVRERWRASDGPGSVLNTDFPIARNLLIWTASGRIIFPWEKDGWQHLYALNARDSLPPVLLTPGSGEIEYMDLGLDNNTIICSGNIGDAHSRNVWTIDHRNRFAQVSSGNAVEWGAVQTTRGIVAFRSTPIDPGWPVIIGDRGRKIAHRFLSTATSAPPFSSPQVVSFTAPDEQQVYGTLTLPPGYDSSRRYPALLFLHGGPERQMLTSFHYREYYWRMYGITQYLAANGFIVFAVNYRGGIGYGLDFRECLECGPEGAAEYQDVAAGALYLAGRKDVDQERMGVWGGSYGGYLAAMALIKQPELFAAGVDIHGVHDWNGELSHWVPDYASRKDATAISKRAHSASPLALISTWKKPVLLVHGDDDRNVPFDQTVRLSAALRKQGVPVSELILPGETHNFLLHASWVRVTEQTKLFFEKHVTKSRSIRLNK